MTPDEIYISPPLAYNADINLIASVPDLRLISNALAGRANSDQVEHRTQRTTTRLERVVRVNLQRYYNSDHQALIESVFAHENALPAWNRMLFWQLALTNRLVFEILDEVFFKYYFEGRGTLPKGEIIAYLKEQKIRSSETGEEWAENTLERIASKLLTFLKRLEVMEGSRIKHFQNITLSQQEWVLFCYLLMAVYPDSPNYLEVPFRKFAFASREVLVEQVRKLALKEYLEVQFDGDKLKLNTKHPYGEITHVLYH